MNLIERTFNTELKTLPTNKEIVKEIEVDYVCSLWKEFNPNYDIEKESKKHIQTFRIRSEYVKRNFHILSHEFLESFKAMVEDLKFQKIVEVCCGTGWFAFWCRKYGINIFECIDNKTWHSFKEYLPIVKKQDAIKYIQRNKDFDLVILAWPYMDNVAYNIWEALEPGKYLFYIGETYGGCTADESFFKATEEKEIEDNWNLDKNILSFFGVHDRPTLFKRV